ncbi:MAG: acyltransferase, partial [Planctomycetes bacterium]|nr:acyltransferase [Planctomycetota bacterium]
DLVGAGPGGYLGVDVFFVISGYVITSSLATRRSTAFVAFITAFYTRRISRLFPAFALFVAANAVLTCLFTPHPAESLNTGMTSLFGVSNVYLALRAADYFATSTELNTFTHTWSLGVEEQFYFIFPLLVWATGFARSADTGERKLLLLTSILTASSFGLFLYAQDVNPSVAYFMMPCRFWELGAGSVLFLSLRRFSQFRAAAAGMPSLAVLVSLLMILRLMTHKSGLAPFYAVLLTSFLLACSRPGTLAYQILTTSPLVYIGAMSYSLYLWHWGVLSISRSTIGISWTTLPFQSIIILLVSCFSYRYVEAPLRRTQWSKLRYGTIGYWVTASICGSVLIAVASSRAHRLFVFSPINEMQYATHWDSWVDCDYVPGPANRQLGGCKFLANGSYPARIVVIGDSHAGHLASGLRSIAPSLPSSVIIVLHAGEFPTMQSQCPVIHQAFRYVMRDPGVDLVILAAYHNLTTHGNRLISCTTNPNDVSSKALEKLEADLRSTVTALTSSGKAVLMIVDSHELPSTPELEVNQVGYLRHPGVLDVSAVSVEARNTPYYAMLARIASEDPMFTVFYSGEVFRVNGVYRSDMNGKPLFQSPDHLAPFGSKVVASRYQDIVRQLLSSRQ